MSPAQNHVLPRRRFRRYIAVAALVGLVLGLSGPADGYWTATSTGSHARSDAATLPAPDLTAAAMTATGVALSWTQPFEPTGYDLTQTPGTLDGCAAHPATSAADCTASGLTPNMSYTWSLSAQLHQWRSPATLTATTPKQATTTTISNITPQSDTAGSAFSATAKVTGKSGYGTPAGTLTFSLYPTAGCTGPASFTTPAQAIANGLATGSLQPTAGTYHWQAIYTPTDIYNTASISACSDPITVIDTGGTYFATGEPTTVTHDGENVIVHYPAGTTKGDLVLLVLLDTENHPSTMGSPGWTDIDHSTDKDHMGLQSWWHTAGTETSVALEHLHTTGPVSGASAWVITYKDMPNPTLVSHSSGTASTALGTVTPPNLNTNAANTTVISLMGTNRSSGLSLSTARNFDLRTSQTTTNPPHALGVADRLVSAAGTVNPPSWQSGLGLLSQWVYTTAAFTSSP